MANDPENTLHLETTQGPVVILMRPDLAPGHVARIKDLVRDGFYDGVVFHRVIDGFMAQTGDPTGTGMGGSGQKLPAEFSRERFVRGTVGIYKSKRTNKETLQVEVKLPGQVTGSQVPGLPPDLMEDDE